MDKTTLIDHLKVGEVTITFLKKDSDQERVLKCTLQDAILPAPIVKTQNKDGSARKRPDHIVVVWDVEAEGWRSFHFDSIKEISI